MRSFDLSAVARPKARRAPLLKRLLLNPYECLQQHLAEISLAHVPDYDRYAAHNSCAKAARCRPRATVCDFSCSAYALHRRRRS